MDRNTILRTQDIERLRMIALALETETRILYGRGSALRVELAEARHEVKDQIELELKSIT